MMMESSMNFNTNLPPSTFASEITNEDTLTSKPTKNTNKQINANNVIDSTTSICNHDDHNQSQKLCFTMAHLK